MKNAIVIGAGAGGCAAARELVGLGWHVALVERGSEFKPFAYQLKTFEPLRQAGLFVDTRMIQAVFGDMRIDKMDSMPLVRGRGIGGTTHLATANALRYDDDLKALGIDLDDEFDELADLVPQCTNHQRRWSDLTRQTFEAFEAEGFDPRVMPKMVDEDRCVACGKCVLGCKLGAKWTADKLLEGLDQSLVDVMESCTVTKLTCENNHVTGVVCRQGLRTVTLDADLVLLAAGGVGTPKILDRSGIPSKPTFFVDPVLCVAAPWENARFDSEIPMPFASQRDGYILSPYFDFLSFFFDKKWRAPSKDIFSLMIKFADDEVGSVTARTVSKPLTDHDYETMARAVDDCRRIMGRLGIRESDTFYGMLNAGHPGGAYPLTQAEAETLHHQELPDNLYLADSTLFNASMGNPPILTIMALAKKVAKTAAAR